MPPRLRRAVALLLIGAAAAFPAQAQWKWRDKGGVVQYSDLPPPPGVPERDILQRPGSARAAQHADTAASAQAAGTDAAASGVDGELEARRRKLATDTAAKAASAAQADQARIATLRRENCGQAKAQMRTLDSGVRISRVNERGEREYLDDNAHSAEVQRTQAAVAANCN